MEDTKIIALYWQRNPDAIDQSAKKYGRYCLTVANRILFLIEDAEECVNDTWFRAWNAMPPHRPNYLQMFFAKLTRCAALDRLKADCTQKRGGKTLAVALEELSECLTDETDTEDHLIAKELEDTIDRFVRSLPEREGNIFIRRYFFTEPVAEIARRYRLSVSNTGVILSRTRQKLKQQLIREGYLYEQK